MQFFIIAAAIAAASAIPAVVNTGSSAVSRSEDGHGNYAFGYNEDHATGGTFRKEQGGPGHVSGSYGLRDIDGRVRTVNYVADALGYRASVSTNEPGTDVKQDPAAADFNLGGAYAAAPIVAAPLIAKSYAAPLVAQSYAGDYSGHYTTPVIAKSYVAQSHSGAYSGHYAAPISGSYSVATQHFSSPVYTQSYAAPLVAGHGYNAYNKHY